jgi:hypothetical protein
MTAAWNSPARSPCTHWTTSIRLPPRQSALVPKQPTSVRPPHMHVVSVCCPSSRGRVTAATTISSQRSDAAMKGDVVSSDLTAARDAKTILLTTYKRNGTPVETPVSIAFERGRAFFRSYHKAWKTKRLRHNSTPTQSRNRTTYRRGSASRSTTANRWADTGHSTGVAPPRIGSIGCRGGVSGQKLQRLAREGMTFHSSWTARTLIAVRQVSPGHPAGSEGGDGLD